MMLALDAHLTHPEPFSVDELLPYQSAREPECQRQAIHRHRVCEKPDPRPNGPSYWPNWNADISRFLATCKAVEKKRRS